MSEAELELRSWYDSNPGGKERAFGPDGQSTGVKGSSPSFPVLEATELLKLRCVSFSVSSRPESNRVQAHLIDSRTHYTPFRSVRKTNLDRLEIGRRGNGRRDFITCGPLDDCYLRVRPLHFTLFAPTDFSRHVCEHVLSQLARVVARDSSIAVAGVQDLYVALCEDENIWGLFKRLQGEHVPSIVLLSWGTTDIDSQDVSRKRPQERCSTTRRYTRQTQFLHLFWRRSKLVRRQVISPTLELIQGYTIPRSISTISLNTRRTHSRFERQATRRTTHQCRPKSFDRTTAKRI